MAVSFNESVIKEFEDIARRYTDRRATLLPALWLAMREFRYISTEVMQYIAELVQVPYTRVYEVVEFYTMFLTNKPGKYHLQVCQTLSCQLRGSDELKEFIETRLGLENGACTPDGLFSYQQVECLGSCHTAPVVQVNDDFHENLDVPKLEALLEKLKKGEVQRG
ncbi:MAG: NAD(P)H-dependent oxidoreductase subunit E [Leptospiraceae bacterium]|nr:NAD(P)H-dependent oxidoreductase subunit E [Leptospiraceae bacterium]